MIVMWAMLLLILSMPAISGTSTTSSMNRSGNATNPPKYAISAMHGIKEHFSWQTTSSTPRSSTRKIGS